MEPTKIEFRKVRDFGALINATFEFLKVNFKSFSLSIIFICGPIVFLTGIFQGFYNVSLFDITSELDFGVFIGQLLLYGTFTFLSIIFISATSYEYILIYLKRDDISIPITTQEVWEGVKNNIWIYLFTAIGSVLIVLGASLLLIIPGIFFSVVLTIIYIIRVNENLPFWEAVKRCRYLVRNKWWLTLGLLMVFAMIQYFFSFILQIPQLVVTVFEIIREGRADETSLVMQVITILSSILSTLSILFYSISNVGMAFHYFSLSEQKDATGLLNQIESI